MGVEDPSSCTIIDLSTYSFAYSSLDVGDSSILTSAPYTRIWWLQSLFWIGASSSRSNSGAAGSSGGAQSRSRFLEIIRMNAANTGRVHTDGTADMSRSSSSAPFLMSLFLVSLNWLSKLHLSSHCAIFSKMRASRVCPSACEIGGSGFRCGPPFSPGRSRLLSDASMNRSK